MGRYALVVGEALVDLIEGHDREGGLTYHPRYGGSPFNVAIGAARLGTTVQFATALGADSFGQQLRTFLDQEQVHLATTPDPRLRTCLAVATRTAGTVDYEYFGDSEALLQIPPVSAELGDGAAVIHAGSTAFNADPALATVLRLYASQAPLKTMDPNPRPRLIGDREQYVTRLEGVIEHVDLVKLSCEDVDYLAPGATADAFAEQTLGLGPSAVLVTHSNRATTVVTRQGSSHVPVPAVDAIDPTGAGDSFMACLLTDLCREGLPTDLAGWERLTLRANTAAAITCTSVGGASSMPTGAQLSRRLRRLG